MSAHRSGLACVLLLAGLGGAAPAAGEWRVLCALEGGTVEAVERAALEGESTLAGPFGGPSTARAWIEERCPSRRCSAAGQCAAAPTPRPDSGLASADEPAAAGGPLADDWEAGAVVELGAGAPAPAARPAPPAAPLGPDAADLSGLVAIAAAAARACRYDAALSSAGQMARFEPSHPWLVANHDKLRQLAARQESAERSVWQAAAELERGDFAAARTSARAASDAAVSCQSQAVSQLVFGIESADERLRAERQAARQRIAAALVVPLLRLANTLIDGGGGGTVPRGVGVPAGASSGTLAGAADRCAYQYAYPNEWTFTPSCTCAGWTFVAAQYRCFPPRS